MTSVLAELCSTLGCVLDVLFRIKNCNRVQPDMCEGAGVGRLLITGTTTRCVSGSHKTTWVLTAGNLAEAAKHLQGRLQPLCGQLVPIILRELRDSEAGNRQNAAFCAGLLAQYCPEQVHRQLGQLLQVSHIGGPHVHACLCIACIVW